MIIKKYINFIKENINYNYSNDGFIIKHNNWNILYNHTKEHDLLQKFQSRKNYELDPRTSIKKEINNIIKIIVDYFDNNYINDNNISIEIENKNIFIIVNINIFKNKLYLITFLDKEEMKVKKNTRIIKI
jgi:hypothetical protein